jgi:hypothetical protein
VRRVRGEAATCLEEEGFDRHFSRVYLHHDELLLINNALNEITNGPNRLPGMDFRPRTGAFRDEALTLLKQCNELVDQLTRRGLGRFEPHKRSDYLERLR